jgi:hypothetical protein
MQLLDTPHKQRTLNSSIQRSPEIDESETLAKYKDLYEDLQQ